MSKRETGYRADRGTGLMIFPLCEATRRTSHSIPRRRRRRRTSMFPIIIVELAGQTLVVIRAPRNITKIGDARRVHVTVRVPQNRVTKL